MAGASFLGGALSGYSGTATKKKDKEKDSGQKKPSGLEIFKNFMKGKKKPKPSSDDSGGSGIPVGQYKRGGRVKRTGLAKVHRGERVLTKKQARRYSKR